MSIDWITVLAQMANFLLLVWLLKRFLYRPILDGIDARETEIATRMAQAGIAEQQAQTEAARYKAQQAQLHERQQLLVTDALNNTKAQRDALLSEARTQLEQEQQAWQRYLSTEREKFNQQLQRNGEQALLTLTRKALHDLADESLEAAIVSHVGKRLAPLATELMAAAGETNIAVASTRKPLANREQEQLRACLSHLLPKLTLSFVTHAEQAPGLILQVGGAQVAWTIDSYADELTALLGQHNELTKRHE
ncbi:F0F1 ATP synthase subunit B family protein [Oceanisphaera sp. W20_SRM_FM3]|uniref:F0F1 ATP synthase subunit B family protein n=1 Tax=Oceanisphaera sp. W20_SRM_FM3 TaxID=3240267 RepID=UPI003F956045